jgi:hypothetical protein
MTRTDSFSSDLAFVRDLAEAGQYAPLLGGRFLAWWGGLMTLAYTGHFLISSGTFGVGPQTLWIWWAGMIGLGLAGQFLLQASIPAKPGASSAGNQVQSTLWMCAGFVLFAYFVGVIARVALFKDGWEGFYWSVPMVIGLYGLGQFVTGLIARQPALRFAGIAALCGAAVAGALSGTEYVWLVGAGVAFIAVCVPGLAMLRNEPGTTV